MEALYCAVSFLAGGALVGGWWYCLGHRHGIRSAATAVQTAVKAVSGDVQKSVQAAVTDVKNA